MHWCFVLVQRRSCTSNCCLFSCNHASICKPDLQTSVTKSTTAFHITHTKITRIRTLLYIKALWLTPVLPEWSAPTSFFSSYKPETFSTFSPFAESPCVYVISLELQGRQFSSSLCFKRCLILLRFWELSSFFHCIFPEITGSVDIHSTIGAAPPPIYELPGIPGALGVTAQSWQRAALFPQPLLET